MTTPSGSAGRRSLAVAVAAGAAGAALALAALWATGEITSPANAQNAAAAKGDVTLSAQQLVINQRISQAAVRRSNESLDLLDPLRGRGLKGWRTQDLRDGVVTGPKLAANAVTTNNIADAAVTGPKLAAGSVGGANLTADLANQLPMWAVVNPAGGIVRQRGVTNVENTQAGVYRVTFGRDVSQCSYTATQNAFFGMIGTINDGANANAVLVATSNSAQPPVATNRAFTLHVLC